MSLRKLMIVALAMAAAVVTARAAPDISVLPAMVRGVVLLPDGETPVKGTLVRVWNADTEEVIYKTRADDNGLFEVPKLTEGHQYVTVGSVRIEMRVLTARGGVTPQPHGFVVIVPKALPLMPVLVPAGVTAGALPEIMSN
jgi:hypothetical protein